MLERERCWKWQSMLEAVEEKVWTLREEDGECLMAACKDLLNDPRGIAEESGLHRKSPDQSSRLRWQT